MEAVFVLFVFIFGAAGPYSDATVFESLEECEKNKTKQFEMVESNNQQPDKFAQITHFAFVCAPVGVAPKGKGV